MHGERHAALYNATGKRNAAMGVGWNVGRREENYAHLILRRQIRVIIRVLRKVEGFVKVTQLPQAVSRRRGRASLFTRCGLIIEGWCRGVEVMVDARQCGKAKTTLDELH